MGEVGLDQTVSPTLEEFWPRFFEYIDAEHVGKPETMRFYKNRMKRLLEWKEFRDVTAV